MTVFQVYGPEEMRSLQKLLTKIREDFNGALRHWNDRMHRWIFVHNSRRGLPAQAIQLLEDLGKENAGPDVKAWGYAELLQLFRGHLSEPLKTSKYRKGIADRPLRKPSEIRDLFLPYWRAVKNSPRSSASRVSGVGHHNFSLAIRLFSPSEVAHIVAREEREIADAKIRGAATNFAERPVPSQHDELGVGLIELLQAHRRVLIVGDFGTGKSTLLRRYLRNEVKRLCNKGISKLGRRTPVLIELWRFSEHRSVTDLFGLALSSFGLQLSSDQMDMIFSEGYVTLLLDGLDEIRPELRRECIAQILHLIDKYPFTYLVITSRPFPSPPEVFHEVAISPLTDKDIQGALASRFGSGRAFRKRFDSWSTEHYVSSLRPEVRQLCRRPLTLMLILTALDQDGDLPSTLNGVYDRFFAQLLDWESRRGRLSSVSSAASLLEETAYLMATRAIRGLPVVDVIRHAAHAIEPNENNAEDIFNVMASTGLMRISNGEVWFSHQTFLEFLTARRICRLALKPETDPLAAQFGVARFLCGRVEDVRPLMKVFIDQSDNIEALMPLLEEASNGKNGSKFGTLVRAVAIAQELSIELTHSGSITEEEIDAVIEDIVIACEEFRPKALLTLKKAANGIALGRPWPSSERWFNKIVSALKSYGWLGCELQQRFSKVLFDDKPYGDQDKLRNELLMEYLGAIYKDDFESAAHQLKQLENLQHAAEGFRENERDINRDLQHIISPQLELPKHMEDPIGFLTKNPYGFLYGDDDEGKYEFTWVSTAEVLFENASDLVRSLHECEFEETTLAETEWRVEESLVHAKRSFEEFGLSADTLEILISTMYERTGISWWGLFDDLKNSEEMWPKLIRDGFRNGDHPIQKFEELQFADYVTQHPFEWGYSSPKTPTSFTSPQDLGSSGDQEP
jgi:hypothetical protein